jgi:LacI family transcriptional regulator
VARLAGVSIATVSNTLNRPGIVAAATRERVLAAIEKLEFVPSSAAAALRQGTSRTIGFVIPDVTNPFYSAIARGVADAADEAGYGVSLCMSRDDPERELRQFELLAQQRAAGALVVPLTADSSRLATLRNVGAHLILIDRAARPDEGCSVVIDDVSGGRIAMRHLLATRGERVVLVNGRRTIPQCVDRRAGAREAMREAGLDPDGLREIEVDDMTSQAGMAVGGRLARDGLPAGIFCTNDLLASGVIRGLTQAGARLPADVAVVGYGDLFPATEAVIPLTTIEQPTDLLGRVAVEKLLDEVAANLGVHQHTTTVFEPSLVIRASAPA